MLTANLRQAREVILMAIQNNQSVMLLGDPGIGKTQMFSQIAERIEFACSIFEGPSLDPTDVRGVLIPVNGKSYFTKSPLLPIVEEDGEKGILVIDELSSALPSVQVSMHPLFLERRLGTHKLPAGWMPMATGNYASNGAGAYNLLTALSDRVCIINVVPDVDVWKQDFAIPNGVHTMVLGYINFKPANLSTFAQRNKNQQGKQFGTPRTHWEVSKVLHYHDKHPLSDNALYIAIAGWVGEGLASEYMAFRESYMKLPDPKDIYAGKDIIPTEPSVLWSLCSAIVLYLNGLNGSSLKKAIGRFLEYIQKLPDEFGILSLKDAFVTHSKSLVVMPEFKKLAKNYKFYFED